MADPALNSVVGLLQSVASYCSSKLSHTLRCPLSVIRALGQWLSPRPTKSLPVQAFPEVYL